MPDLLVIVPSRGRPHNIAALHDAWGDTTTGAARLLVAADADDPTLLDYVRVCAHRNITLTVGPRLRMVPTLNKVALEHADEYFAVGFLGDDHRPRTIGWNDRYLDALHGLGTGWVYGDDGYMHERLPTQVAMTSDIVQALGYMAPPGLIHTWADNAWHDLGHAIGRIRYLPDVMVEHMHPIVGKAQEDAGYTEVNSPEAFERDRLAYAHWYEHQMPDDIEKLQRLISS